jgi:hypothetical protein
MKGLLKGALGKACRMEAPCPKPVCPFVDPHLAVNAFTKAHLPNPIKRALTNSCILCSMLPASRNFLYTRQKTSFAASSGPAQTSKSTFHLETNKRLERLPSPDHEIYRYKLRPLGTVFYRHIKGM